MRPAALILTIAFLSGDAPQLTDYTGDWSKMASLVPSGYICYRANQPILIDGRPDDPAWADAPWTEFFQDIEGNRKAKPRFQTRAKMLWDDHYFYVLAHLEEPHVWATLTKKNSVIFHDNDFEVFIDPDGDNHNYYEFEINAFNTIWELILEKPYMDGGPAIEGKNLERLKSAVFIDGTLNNPSDIDRSWSIEIAFPWRDLSRHAGELSCPPRDKDQWRVAFSRVEWLVNILQDRYQKVEGRPEDNWVWSPQGIVNMHRPERWGYVEFSTAASGSVQFNADPTLPARDLLMEIYHRQRAYFDRFKKYAGSLEALGMQTRELSILASPIRITTTDKTFTAAASLNLPGGSKPVLQVQQDSRLVLTHSK